MFTLKGCGLSEARNPSGNYKQTSEASVVSLRPTKIWYPSNQLSEQPGHAPPSE